MKLPPILRFAGPLVLGLCTVTVPSSAQEKGKRNPVSKVYISDVSGEALIESGESIQDLSKRAVYPAQGSVIETKKPLNASDRSKYYSTMVYSNGTGAFIDEDTRVEVRRFMQEPFTPNRTDLEVEPSISQTQAFVARGAVGLCLSKLVAGSSMTYNTRHGSVNIRGRKIVIEAFDDHSKISMLEGDGTVRAGPNDLSGHTVRSGEQAIIRRGASNDANVVEIKPIPAAEASKLDDRVAMACLARRTVYFDVSELDPNNVPGPNGAGISAFDAAPGGPREIVAIQTVPVNLPVQFTVSPAALVTPPTAPGQGPRP